MVNKRIFYAAHQVSIGETSGAVSMAAGSSAHGVQSVGVTTNFNLEPLFELGKLSLYENIEEIPDIEISISKVLDGHPLLFHLATQETALTDAEPTLIGRSNTDCQVGIGIYPDDQEATASESSVSAMIASGMFVSSVSYNFPLDGNFSEDISLVGNNKVWKHAPNYGNTLNTNFDTYSNNVDVVRGFGETDAPNDTDMGVNRRQDLIFTIGANAVADSNGAVDDANTTVLPPEVFGITNSGTNEVGADGSYGAHLSNITVSANLTRDSINELGRKAPYHRFASFPIEVTTEITATSHSGDMTSAIEEGIYNTGTTDCEGSDTNLQDRTIRIATCEDTRIYCGLKNKLSAVNYSGGDTGGGNVEVSWTFTTYNDMTVLHSQDPHASGSEWWTNRATYLTENG